MGLVSVSLKRGFTEDHIVTARLPYHFYFYLCSAVKRQDPIGLITPRAKNKELVI